MMTREDAVRALAAALMDAAAKARILLEPWEADVLAAALIRFAPSEGLSIRLDDGSELPSL